MSVMPDIVNLADAIRKANDPDVSQRSALPATGTLQNIVARYNSAIANKVSAAVEAQNGSLQQELGQDIKAAGWVAAPVWFQTFARLNGQILEAAYATPQIGGPNAEYSWPSEVLEAVTAADRYWHATVSDMKQPTFDTAMAGDQDSGPLDHLSSYLMTNWVADFRFTSTDPLSEIVAFGHKLIAFATYLFAVLGGLAFSSSGGWLEKLVTFGASGGTAGVAGAGAAAATSVMGKGLAGLLSFAGSFFTAVDLALLTAGMALAIILPLTPLIQWTYGCLSWLLLGFEAILAMQIFMIAHLRTDGEGFAGPSAQNGYTILLGLIFKPILMVISLIISLQIFNVTISLFNVLFIPSMKSAQAGNFMGFVMLVMWVVFYAITVYGIGNVCFKAIDQIPNQVLRWIGGHMGGDVAAPHSNAMQQGADRLGQGIKDGLKNPSEQPGTDKSSAKDNALENSEARAERML